MSNTQNNDVPEGEIESEEGEIKFLAPETEDEIKRIAKFKKKLNDIKRTRKLKMTQRFDLHKMYFNIGLLCWSTLSTVANLILGGLCFDDDLLTMIPYEYCTFGYPLCFGAWVSSIFSVMCLVGLYKEIIEQDFWRYEFDTRWQTIVQTNSKFSFALELVIVFLNPFPISKSIPYTYEFAQFTRILFCLSLFRIYPISRAIRNASFLYKERDAIVSGQDQKSDAQNKGKTKPKHDVTTTLVIKTYFLQHQIAVIGALYLFAVVIFARSLMVIERSFWIATDDNTGISPYAPVPYRDGQSFFPTAESWQTPLAPDENLWAQTVYVDFFTCIWLTVITMTSIGYGDIAPHTTCGRVLGLFIGLLGIVNTSLIVSAMCDACANCTDFEQFLKSWLRKKELRSEMEHLSIRLIAESFEFNMERVTFTDKKKIEKERKSFLQNVSSIIQHMRQIRLQEKVFTMAETAMKQMEVMELKEMRGQLEEFKHDLTTFVSHRKIAADEFKEVNQEHKERKTQSQLLRKLPSRNKRVTFE